LDVDAGDDRRDGEQPGDDGHAELDVDVSRYPGGSDEGVDRFKHDEAERQDHKPDAPRVLKHRAPVGHEHGMSPMCGCSGGRDATSGGSTKLLRSYRALPRKS